MGSEHAARYHVTTKPLLEGSPTHYCQDVYSLGHVANRRPYNLQLVAVLTANQVRPNAHYINFLRLYGVRDSIV